LLLLLAPATAQQDAPQSNSHLQRLSRWLKSRDETVRLDAVKEASTLPKSESLPFLMQALKDPSAEVRSVAAWSLENVKDPQAVTALRQLLKEEKGDTEGSDRVRAAAVWSLSHIGGRQVLPEVAKLAKEDPSGIVRFRAVWGLASIGDMSALSVAIEALGDENVSVRERAALLALEALQDGSIASRLLKLTAHPQADTRRLVMYLLARYGDKSKSAVPALTESLRDAEALVRAEAALSLGKLRARTALDKLLPLLKDPDEHVRGSAAYAVGLIGGVSAMEASRQLLKDESAFVRAVAAESLQRLGDKTVQPPEGFKAVELFTYPIYSPEHTDLYR
jgi:HEAT repeat protein